MDFGQATIAQDSKSLESTDGGHGYTARFTAPEVLKNGRHSKESDVFAFGMVVIEVGDDGSAPRQITLLVEGLHWQGPVQYMHFL